MKLNYFKFQDGKVFWLPEYPTRKGCENNCTWNKAYCGDCPDWKDFHGKEAQSLASAIEVTPEDMIDMRILIAKTTSIWVLESGKVYSAECEMEVAEQWALKGTHEWYNDDDERFELHHPDDTDYRQVARLKPIKP